MSRFENLRPDESNDPTNQQMAGGMSFADRKTLGIQNLLNNLKPGEQLWLDAKLEQLPKRDPSCACTFERLKYGNIRVFNGLPSKNGTYILDKNLQPLRLQSPALVADGSTIKVGGTTITLGETGFESSQVLLHSALASLEIGDRLVIGRETGSEFQHFTALQDQRVSQLHCTLERLPDTRNHEGAEIATYKITDGYQSDLLINIETNGNWFELDGSLELGCGRRVKLALDADSFITLEIPNPPTPSKIETFDPNRFVIFDARQLPATLNGIPALDILPGYSTRELSKLPEGRVARARPMFDLALDMITELRRNNPEQVIEVLTTPENWQEIGYRYNDLNKRLIYQHFNDTAVVEAVSSVRSHSRIGKAEVQICVATPAKESGSFWPDEAQLLDEFKKCCATIYIDLLLTAVQQTLDQPLAMRQQLLSFLPMDLFDLSSEDLKALDRMAFMQERNLRVPELALDQDNKSRPEHSRTTALAAIQNYAGETEQRTISRALAQLSHVNSLTIGFGSSRAAAQNPENIRIELVQHSTELDPDLAEQREALIASQIAKEHVVIRYNDPGSYRVELPSDQALQYPVFVCDCHGYWQRLSGGLEIVDIGSKLRLGSSFEFTLRPW